MQKDFGFNSDWTPGKIQFNSKNILEASEKYILNSVHIWNFDEYPNYENYFNKYIFAKYEYANCFENCVDIETGRGDISVQGTGRSQKKRYVINMYTKRFPEVVEDLSIFEQHFDTPNYRMRNFICAMNKVFRIKNLKSIAMQEKFVNDSIDKNWNKYLTVLQKYAVKYPQVKIAVYCGKFQESVLLAFQKNKEMAQKAAEAAQAAAQNIANAAQKVAKKVE